MALQDFLTIEEPLGPILHERILKRHFYDNPADRDPMDTLIYSTKTFDMVLKDTRPILMGRRGSGKTAVVAAFLSRSGRTHYSYTRDDSSNNSCDTYAFIQSWDHLDELVNQVGLDCLHSLGGQPLWDELLPETAARFWARRLWEVVFKQIYKDSSYEFNTCNYRTELPDVFRFIEGADIVDPRAAITDRALNEFYERVRDSVIDFLARTNHHCYIVIDSLDMYPVNSPRFMHIVGGLLRCISDFSTNYKNVHLVCCIPEELEPFMLSHVANALRDLSPLSSVSRLHWRPFDLLRIVAERYRAFLQIHVEDDNSFMDWVTGLEFADRDSLAEFYRRVMPTHVDNRYGQQEDALAYIIRHTQLLPREFILIFSHAIKISHQMRGTWRYVEPRAIVQAIKENERMLADQILKPYKPIYSELIGACVDTLPSLPPICSLSDLHRIGARMKRRTLSETENPWRSLFEIGVIGYIDPVEQNNRHSEHYEYGCFHFNSSTPITFAEHMRYCVHPIFSGTWNLNRTEDMKFVYPARMHESIWMS